MRQAKKSEKTPQKKYERQPLHAPPSTAVKEPQPDVEMEEVIRPLSLEASIPAQLKITARDLVKKKQKSPIKKETQVI